MNGKRQIGLVLMTLMLAPVLATAPPGDADPVMKARAERASAQGISDADLPPVPKGVTDPPPLPQPEIHRRDTRQARTTRAARGKGKTKTSTKHTPGKSRTPARRGKKKSAR